MSGFFLPVRVYLEDTDAQGVVYNASYFRFMERARTELLRYFGIDHADLDRDHGLSLVLAAIDARFKSPARLSDMLFVGADVESVQGARLVFHQRIHRGTEDGPLLCEGHAEVACMDSEQGTPKRFPASIIERLTA